MKGGLLVVLVALLFAPVVTETSGKGIFICYKKLKHCNAGPGSSVECASPGIQTGWQHSFMEIGLEIISSPYR